MFDDAEEVEECTHCGTEIFPDPDNYFPLCEECEGSEGYATKDQCDRWINNVSSSRGAPMGRRSYGEIADIVTDLETFLLPSVDGDYDTGGAYWGFGSGSKPIRCTVDYDKDGELVQVFARER